MCSNELHCAGGYLSHPTAVQTSPASVPSDMLAHKLIKHEPPTRFGTGPTNPNPALHSNKNILPSLTIKHFPIFDDESLSRRYLFPSAWLLAIIYILLDELPILWRGNEYVRYKTLWRRVGETSMGRNVWEPFQDFSAVLSHWKSIEICFVFNYIWMIGSYDY